MKHCGAFHASVNLNVEAILGRNWTRNLPLKIGAVVAALAGTLGFYGLIQAHPLAGQTSSTGATATAPASGASGDPQPTPIPPATSGDDSPQPVQQTPQQTIPRQRISRGS
ncbi:MAG: hypothetical protein ACRDG3_03305 [Tepidiformaceae bacterium]